MNAMQAFQPYGDRVDFIDITGRPMPAILDKVANLPQRTLVMYITLLEDGAGNKFTARQSASQISRVTNAPVYSFWDLMLGHGIVGGYLSSAEEKGKAAAALALRILKGEQPSDIPLSIEGSLNAMFDWRELKRWSINEDLLPLKSIIKFKELSTWERYQNQVIAGLVLIVLQGLVIAYLLYQRRGRIRAERVLEGQLAFERFSAQLSSEFIRLPTDLTESKILTSLARVGAFLEADRAYVFRFNWEKTRFIISHLWESNSTEPDQTMRGTIVKDFIPWVYENLINGRDIIIPDTEQLPALEAFNEYEYCRQIGIRSFVIIPVQVADAPLCAIGLDAVQARKDWPIDIRDRLRLIGEIFANAIERQHSDKRAKASEWKFRTMVDHTYDWEYWQAADGSMTYVSPSSERISGYTPQDFIRSPELLAEIIVPEDRKIWSLHRCNNGRQSGSESLLTFRIQQRNGDIRWIEHACQPVFGLQGVDLGVRGSNRDVSKREFYKSETRQLQSDLAHMDRIVTVSALTSALAHEINQPLAAMRSYAQAALRFMDKDQPEYDSVRKALQGVVADNKRAAAVVNRLRGLVRKETGHWEALEINSLINGVISLINSEIVLRKASIKLNLHQSVPEVFGDSVQLQQVLINLLTNALDAMEDQPTEARVITISTRPENALSAFVSISDSGEGIPSENIKTIFAPFQTTKSKGIGLGLAICKTIMEAHGGEIWAENTLEGGAIFSLILPAIGQAT
jgi:two-component system sensor kinase FixL